MDYKLQLKPIKKEIPIFFSVDDNYASFLLVALKSIQENSSRDYNYSVYVLHDGLNKDTMLTIKSYEDENYKIKFVNVKLKLLRHSNKLHTRDYYSKSTYYRLFIQRLFPKYDKVIYLDSDIIVTGDISELYNIDLGEYLVSAGHEDVMQNTEVFGSYVEQVLGIDRNNYFNAGVLVINLKLFRKEKVEEQFLRLISKFKFTVTQDEDYLNVICKDRVLFFDRGWNLSPEVELEEEKIRLVHYKMANKPWHYDDVRYGDYFWKYAVKTDFYQALKFTKDNYSAKDKEYDIKVYNNLVQMAKEDMLNPNNYFNQLKKSREEKINA